MIKKSKLIYIIGSVIIGVSIMLIAFLILITNGTIDTRTKLVFSSGSIEKSYDGTPLSFDKWEHLSGKLKSGHTAAVTVNASRTDAGSSPNYFTVNISDNNGNDVTNDYNIEYRTGELVVIARIIGVKTDSASKEYDGTALTCDSYKIVKGEVVSGHTLTVQALGERTDAGISDNTFVVTISGANKSEVTQNYDIEKVYGRLEVTKRNITISTPSYHSVYDANPVTYNEWKYESKTKILDNHEIEVIISGSQTDFGVSGNSIAEVRITENGKNVTSNYAVTYIEGELIVTKREITIRSDSARKEYDGEPLTNNKWACVSQTKPVAGQTLNVVIYGSQTEPGKSPNYIDAVIRTSDGRDVTYNYDIDKQEGDLVVTDTSGSVVKPGEPDGSGGVTLDGSGNIGAPEEAGQETGQNAAAAAVRVYSGVSDKIYLRYMSFGNYTGSAWETAADYPYLIDSKYSLNYLTGIVLKRAGYVSSPVLIEVFGDNYLLPYYLDTDEFSYTVQASDVKYSGDTGPEYSAYYYQFDYLQEGLNASVPAAYTELERAYNNYVQSKYLSVPVSTNEFLQQIILLKGFDKNNTDIIAAVAEYIRNAASYNEGYNRKMDKESDIAVSFLSVYKEGICQHFATAATMLYRALGIPARYVIGYSGNTESGKWVNLSVKNAHAWVEVYLSGIGWIQVEVSAPAVDEDSTGENGTGEGGLYKTLNIKPVDLSMKYGNGAVLTAENKIQGLTDLLSLGYNYKSSVTGKQTSIGIGYSTVTSFILYDISGKDVTNQFKITFGKGKLHLYVKELTITTETINKIYDGIPLKSDGDGYTLDGELITGHRFARFMLTGMQINVGQSENSCDIMIVDAAEKDVTYMYKINKSYGTLTVDARIITIAAGSASKVYDGKELTCRLYEVSLEENWEPLGRGDRIISVQTEGSQTNVGKSQNEIVSVKIVNEKGNDVTKNYSVKYISGWLIVTRT